MAGTMDGDELRRFMAHWATGVTVVTVGDGPRDFGLTVNAFLSVSLHPPTVLVSLTQDADSTPVLERVGAFAVNLLAFDQRSLSERFAAAVPPEEKFRGLPLRRGVTGAPLLHGTLGALEARVERPFDVADHRLFLGKVVALHSGRDVEPLLFFRSRYSESAGAGSLTLPPSAPPANR
jgi:flavin reductase (DIM6/NTAB) family NADH-FMN oxidoreductase RutF